MVAVLDRKSGVEFIAEFPFTQSWSSIRAYLETLDRACNVQFVADEQESYVSFEFAGFGFCLSSDEAAVLVSTNEQNCPEMIQDELLLRLSRFFRFWLNH